MKRISKPTSNISKADPGQKGKNKKAKKNSDFGLYHEALACLPELEENEEYHAYQFPMVQGTIYLINCHLFWEVPKDILRRKEKKFAKVLARAAIDLTNEFEKMADRMMPEFIGEHFPGVAFKNIIASGNKNDR